MAAPVLARSAVSDSTASPMSSLDLSAIPLVSRSLSEFRSENSPSKETAAASDRHAAYNYREEGEGANWFFASLIEPFYLSLLGAGLLVLGTITWRGNH